jgi:hypothetical protein
MPNKENTPYYIRREWWEKACARGAKFLDKRAPGWYDRIDLTRLDMNDVHKCVLGQLEGYYGDGLYKYELDDRIIRTWEATQWYGFTVGAYEFDDMEVGYVVDGYYWKVLDKAWAEQVANRRIEKVVRGE